jgi:hypothetical protein
VIVCFTDYVFGIPGLFVLEDEKWLNFLGDDWIVKI